MKKKAHKKSLKKQGGRLNSYDHQAKEALSGDYVNYDAAGKEISSKS